ncbi:MAG: SDR family NAD(P)-dependent oxidoreductase [Pseudomonadota bacterium]
MSTGRRALITGCSGGIGRAVALALAARGWRVVGTLRSEAGRAELEAAGVATAHLDLRHDPGAAVGAAIARLGGLDALVANAGQGLFGCFEDMSDAELREQLEVNFFGPAACARAALPALRESRGRLVLVSSIAGRRSAPGSSAYNASKFALEGWAEALRHELAGFGVPVVLVQPGLTATGFATARRRAARAGQGPYAALTRRLEALHAAGGRGGAPVETAVASILAALDQPAPPLRLIPTAQARAELLAARLLPWPLWEALVRRKLRG